MKTILEKQLDFLSEAPLGQGVELFETFAQAVPIQIWSADADGRPDWFNQRAFDYTGVARAQLEGQGWTDFVHPDDLLETAARWFAATVGGEPYESEFRLRNAQGEHRWHLSRAVPIKDAAGKVRRWIGSNTEIHDRKMAEAELLESRQRMEMAVKAADTGIWDYAPQSDILTWDGRCYALFGLSPGQPINFEKFLAGVHPQDRAATEAACLAAMRPVDPQPYEIEYRTVGFEDHVERWVSAQGGTVFSNGVAMRFIGTIRDISRLKLVEHQQRLLTHELGHRIKNMLSMVTAIANQSFRVGATKEEVRTLFEGRIQALSQAHDILTQSSWTSASMRAVVGASLAPHLAEESRFRVSGPDVDLSPKQALALALSLHELITNAIKYGSLLTPSGSVEVSWRLEPKGSKSILHFLWREEGGPPVAAPKRRGFGSRLIESTLSSEFGQGVKLAFNPDGVECAFSSDIATWAGGLPMPP